MEAWQVHVKKDSLHLPRCSYTTGLVAAWKTNDGCCVIVSEYIALLCAIGFQIFSLEPAYQFLLPVFCPYCEAVLLEAVFLIKMMFDVNETVDILCWILVAKRLEDTESYDGVSPPAPRTINCKGKILSILFFVLPKVAMEIFLIRMGTHIIIWTEEGALLIRFLCVIFASELDELAYNSLSSQLFGRTCIRLKAVTIETGAGRKVYALLSLICKLLLGGVAWIWIRWQLQVACKDE